MVATPSFGHDAFTLEKALRYASSGDPDLGAQFVVENVERNDIIGFLTSLLLAAHDMLPSADAKVDSSSAFVHPSLSGRLHRFNRPSQFVFHTTDSNPWVEIDFGDEIPPGCPLYLYNRCHTEEISERIIGCRFWASRDRLNWESIAVKMDNDFIYKCKELEIREAFHFRYLRIDRSAPGGPIHLSQITLGRPKAYSDTVALFCNLVLARIYGLDLDEHGLIVEDRATVKAARIRFMCHDLENEASLRLPIIGRFSNFILQLTNAIAIARRLGIKKIYLPDNHKVRDVFPHARTISCKSYPVTISIGEIPQGVCLEALCLFNTSLLPSEPEFPPLNVLVDEFKHDSHFAGTQLTIPATTLVVHIRSGDIFSEEGGVNSGYGQPPLAYYQEAISHYQPDSVILVYEDDCNPVVAALSDYLAQMSVEYSIQSSSVLRDDVGVLVKSSALVVSNGTFAGGVVAFNPCLETIYTFQRPFRPHFMPKYESRSVKNFVVVDQRGAYREAILNNNWANSPEQRRMMIEYPRGSLVLKESS